MSDAVPPAKRKRTDESAVETPTPTRSHSIWKPFGDIVLQVESTQFRVSRDNLATHSSVFADMFSVPQPPNEPTVDGCPVVILPGDSARDWELLLQSLYDPFGDEEALPFDQIAAMLRLRRKYGIAAAEANAVRRIHLEFPDKLHDWDVADSGYVKIEHYEALALDLLNLAHEFGINSSIPTLAHTSLKMHRMDRILTGLERPDTSNVVLPPEVEKMLAIGTGFQFTSFSWLDNDDVVPSTSCKDRTRCGRGLNDLRHWCISNPRFDAPAFFILENWDEDWSDHFCVECAQTAKNAFKAARLKGWEALPSFFGLPKWDELKDAE